MLQQRPSQLFRLRVDQRQHVARARTHPASLAGRTQHCPVASTSTSIPSQEVRTLGSSVNMTPPRPISASALCHRFHAAPVANAGLPKRALAVRKRPIGQCHQANAPRRCSQLQGSEASRAGPHNPNAYRLFGCFTLS